MIPAVSYMRCSGRGQVDGDTWDRQTDTISRCAATLGFTLEHEFRELAVPGKTDAEDRPAFQEMISALLGNCCKTIIVESLDRLAREYRVQEQLIIYIASKGLTLIAANTGENITEAMLGDPMRRALVQIQGIFAELDKNLIVAKLRKARLRIRNEGRKDDPSNRRVEGRKGYGFHAAEVITLAEMQRLQREGMDPCGIAATLNSMQLWTRYQKPWRATTIRKILARVS